MAELKFSSTAAVCDVTAASSEGILKFHLPLSGIRRPEEFPWDAQLGDRVFSLLRDVPLFSLLFSPLIFPTALPVFFFVYSRISLSLHSSSFFYFCILWHHFPVEFLIGLQRVGEWDHQTFRNPYSGDASAGKNTNVVKHFQRQISRGIWALLKKGPILCSKHVFPSLGSVINFPSVHISYKTILKSKTNFFSYGHKSETYYQLDMF